MEPIKSYLTKEGWSSDLEKTIERHPKIYEIFKSVIGRHLFQVGTYFIWLRRR